MGDPNTEGGARAAGADSAAEVTVRVSPRARRVRLVMSAGDGLVVVVPRGFDRGRVPEILARHEQWIDRARRKVEAQYPSAQRCSELPVRIDLPAVAETWVVEYVCAHSRTAGVRVATSARERRLVLRGHVDDVEACRAALLRWLNRRARAVLVPRLEALAADHGFLFERVSIRQQRSRWGSCSCRRTISLNARLLFFPSDLVDYVLIHELCHTVELNHSPRFWRVLEEHHPGSVVFRRRLRKASDHLPSWLDAPLAGPPAAGAIPC